MEKSLGSQHLWCVLLSTCVACTSQMMWVNCEFPSLYKKHIRHQTKWLKHITMCILVCVFVSLYVCVCCCISNYGLQKPIMIVLPCCDAQDCSLHRQCFATVVCVNRSVCLCVCVCVGSRNQSERWPLGTNVLYGLRGCVLYVCGVCMFVAQVGRWLLTSSQRKS